jgi:hydrogenase expression/formation protein HypC
LCLAIPGRIVDVVDEFNRLAQVDVAGVRRTVNIGLLDADEDGGAGPGDWVLIHVGFALSKVDEEEAHATLELLRGMGSEFEDAIEELKGSVIR